MPSRLDQKLEENIGQKFEENIGQKFEENIGTLNFEDKLPQASSLSWISSLLCSGSCLYTMYAKFRKCYSNMPDDGAEGCKHSRA